MEKSVGKHTENVTVGCSAQRLIFQLASEMTVYLVLALLTGSGWAIGRLPWDTSDG